MGESEVMYKILLVGESGVGKTSLIRTLTGCPFSHNMLSTVGVDFVKVPFEVDGAKIKLQIWDTAGQERFRSITRFQYRATKGLLLVYDVTSKESFETLEYWIQSIEKDFGHEAEPMPIILCGNKCDLVDKRLVSYQSGKSLSERNFFSGFFETSAADGTNVRQSFQSLADSIVDVFNPEMMDMYRLSSAIDVIKRSSACPDDLEVVLNQNNKSKVHPKHLTLFNQNRLKPIKLTNQNKKSRKKPRCSCGKM